MEYGENETGEKRNIQYLNSRHALEETTPYYHALYEEQRLGNKSLRNSKIHIIMNYTINFICNYSNEM